MFFSSVYNFFHNCYVATGYFPLFSVPERWAQLSTCAYDEISDSYSVSAVSAIPLDVCIDSNIHGDDAPTKLAFRAYTVDDVTTVFIEPNCNETAPRSSFGGPNSVGGREPFNVAATESCEKSVSRMTM